MSYQHQSLADVRWQTLTLAEQLGNVGSEVSRAVKARGSEDRYQSAIARALELLDLTIADIRWHDRLKEIVRTREVLADAASHGSEYSTSLEDLDRYFFYFAMAARLSR
ncbi:MAG: hypothetical protein WC477_00820 [Patescibacteria group bacterium]